MRWLAAGLAVVAVWLVLPLAGPAGEEAAPVVAAAAPAGDAGPSGSSARGPSVDEPAVEAMGINEAVTFPEGMVRRQGLTLDRLRPRLEDLAAHAREVGARWARGHTVAFPRLSWDRWVREGGSWARMDLWVAVLQEHGLGGVAMIGPWPGNRTRRFTDRYVVEDVAGYQRFVRAAVERYDGDGVDDMPGLRRPILHWEIDNEPDLKNVASPRDPRPTDFATPAQFAEVLRITAGAIRDACPGCTVLGGSFARVREGSGLRYMRELFARPGVLDLLDVVSVHAYHHGPDEGPLADTLDRVEEAAPGKPVWVTETSVPSEPVGAARGAWITPEWQAEMVVRTYATALARGVGKVFWHTLNDVPSMPGRRPGQGAGPLMLANSLYRTRQGGGLEIKPSGEAYRRLAGILATVPRSAVHPIEVRGGRGLALGDGRRLVVGDGTVELAGPAGVAHRVATGEPVPLTVRGGRIAVEAGRGAVLLEPPDGR